MNIEACGLNIKAYRISVERRGESVEGRRINLRQRELIISD